MRLRLAILVSCCRVCALSVAWVHVASAQSSGRAVAAGSPSYGSGDHPGAPGGRCCPRADQPACVDSLRGDRSGARRTRSGQAASRWPTPPPAAPGTRSKVSTNSTTLTPFLALHHPAIFWLKLLVIWLLFLIWVQVGRLGQSRHADLRSRLRQMESDPVLSVPRRPAAVRVSDHCRLRQLLGDVGPAARGLPGDVRAVRGDAQQICRSCTNASLRPIGSAMRLLSSPSKVGIKMEGERKADYEKGARSI